MDVLAPERAYQPDQGDVLFADEVTAVRVLEADYRRYVRTLQKFAALKPFLRPPRRVLDLGCGAGVITLWLATLYPDAELIGIDWSEGCIRMAEHFKRKLHLSNVRFQCASYEDPGVVERMGRFSLVVNCHGTCLSIPDSESDLVYSYRHLSPEQLRELAPAILRSCFALSKALDESGVGFLDLGWKPLGALCLFQGLRDADLGILWEHSRWSARSGDFGGHVMVRHDMPRLTQSSWDDLNAFASCGFFPEESLEIPFSLVEPCMAYFEAGDVLAAMEFRYYTGGHERIRIVLKAGLILYEHSTSLGFRRGFVHSVAMISKVFERWIETIESLRTACAGRFLSVDVAPALVSYLEASGVITHSEISRRLSNY